MVARPKPKVASFITAHPQLFHTHHIEVQSLKARPFTSIAASHVVMMQQLEHPSASFSSNTIGFCNVFVYAVTLLAVFTILKRRIHHKSALRCCASAGSKEPSGRPPPFNEPIPKLVDIGANLADPVFQGVYRGKQLHTSDFDQILNRARYAGLECIIVTGCSLSESQEALLLAKQHGDLYCTVGVHPTRSSEFSGAQEALLHLEQLREVIKDGDGKVVAVGECGLDYDRLQFCDKVTQQQGFELQFDLAEATGLPMFLHNRNTSGDFVRMMKKHRSRIKGGVAHSFTGDAVELQQLLDLDLYIGINGCSLKTEGNLQVMAQVPLNRLLLETDAPWCEIRPTHASFQYVQTKHEGRKKEKFELGQQVKSRNEPCNLIQVSEVVANYRPDVSSQSHLAEVVHHNALNLFWLNKARFE